MKYDNYKSTFPNGDVLDDQQIKNLELEQCRKALKFIKSKLRPSIIEFLEDEIAESTERTEGYVEQSEGRWKSDSVQITMPGLSFQEYHGWFMGKVKERDEITLQVAHPDHYMNAVMVDRPGFVEIIENVGADTIPWYIVGQFVAADDVPFEKDPHYSDSFWLKIWSKNEVLLGYAGHELRNDENGNCNLKLTIALPEAAPDTLIHGHLEHFTMEFRNWYLSALRALK